jgi:hypothetical protein
MKVPGDFQKIEAAVDRAMAHLKMSGFDDIFRPPIFIASIELQVIRNNVPAIDKYLKQEAIKFLRAKSLINSGIGKPRYFYNPKDHQSFRRVAWFEPIDILKFTSLTLLVVDGIEAGRTPAEMNIVHSHRISSSPSGIFSKEYGYDTFRAASAQKTKEYFGGYKLVTDIANFFDRISLHSLENILKETGCPLEYVKFLNDVLIHFAGGRNSYGIPVGSDASRILSEAALLNVDKRLRKENIDFVRYVDDFRVFSKTRAHLHSAMLLLTEVLQEEGLFLNHSKTAVQKIDNEKIEEEIIQEAINEHQPIKLDEVIVARGVSVTASGRSRISRYYKKPGLDALRYLQALDIKKWQIDIAIFDARQEKIIRDGIKYFLYVDPNLDIIEHAIRTKISSIYYISDALVKDGDRLAPDVRASTIALLLHELDYQNVCYPHAIPLMRILASKPFLRPDILEEAIQRCGLMGNTIYMRELLLLSADTLSRSTIRNLAKNLFPQLPIEIQRAVMDILKRTSAIDGVEREALIKDMRNTSHDLILNFM